MGRSGGQKSKLVKLFGQNGSCWVDPETFFGSFFPSIINKSISVVTYIKLSL